MKKKLIAFLRKFSKYDVGLRLRLIYRLYKQKALYKKYPDDKEFIEMRYKQKTGRELNADKPERFTEKLQWLKLYNHDPLTSKCADKYEVRKYIKSKGYGYLLNDMLASFDSSDDFSVDELPEKFVVKSAHSSSMNFICTDKKAVNWKSKKKIFKLWMKINLYLDGREWVYRDIKPRLIVEKYLEDDSGSLRDYKFFCFDGKSEFIQVDEDRFSLHKQTYYSRKWEKLNFSTGYPTPDVKKPKNLEEMLKVADDLCKEFPFVRVDLYNCNGRVFFGELTFFDGSGFYTFDPDKYDFYFGDMLILPEKKIESDLNEESTVPY